ncbi:transporter substrate-binding domain-containing protein [Undibacterium sp. LX15W]|uniref:Transporter substrate-binding domain-containing protein n=1 Tax=Undibacterium flavidum TaxID=2762297 RepID=A0ABR6Y8D8_9BURK|nr:transporter substrate-binding domain-containing protein [Undibacterium flavidum]
MSSAQAGEKQTVRLFLQENLDQQGKQQALDPKLTEILAYFERETGLKFEPVILPWKRAQLETLHGDGIIYGFSRSAERLRLYHFSQPVVVERIWGVTYGSPKPVYKSVEDLRGKVVSTGRGFSHGMEFDRASNVIFTVQEDSSSTVARFKKLMAKRSDLMVWPVRGFEHAKDVEAYVNRTVVQDSNDPELAGRHFDVTDRPLFYDTTHFASTKGRYEDVIAKIDKAIARGNKNGSLAVVLRGYH